MRIEVICDYTREVRPCDDFREALEELDFYRSEFWSGEIRVDGRLLSREEIAELRAKYGEEDDDEEE